MPYEKYIWNKNLGIWDLVTYPTSIITSGTFDSARIPNLAASKIITGTEGYILKVVSGVATWSNPVSGENNYLTGVTGSGNGTVTFTREGLGNLTWDSSHVHTFASLTSKPTNLSGYGITDAMSTSHAANVITSTNITNWNAAYSWGNHSGLYAAASHTHAFASLTSLPTTLAGYGITDAAASVHTHAASAIVSGTFDAARIGYF